MDKYSVDYGSPARIAAGTDGKFYVTNVSAGTVTVYSNNGVLLYTLNAWEAPLGVQTDAAGRVYISDIRSKFVGVYSLTHNGGGTASANLLFKLGQGDGEFQFPNAIAVSGQNIYVADSKASAIKAYDQSGRALFSFGADMLKNPVGIAADSNEIYVVDSVSSCIRVFNAQGNLLRSIADGSSFLLRPLGVSVDDSRLFVTDAYHSVIAVFDKASGAFLNYVGNYGQGPNEYATPIDLVLDADNKLFITNSNNQRIEVLGVDNFTGLSAMPLSMAFAVYRGGQSQVRSADLNAVGNNTAYTATSASPWLSVSSASGMTPASLTVTANPSGLAAGGYSSSVTFRTPAGTEAYLPVTLDVLKPVLVVDSSSFNVVYQKGSREFPSGSLTIDSVGAALNWTATVSKKWLIIDKTSGTTVPPSRINVRVARTVKDFKPGVYDAQIIIDAGDVVNGPATIAVRLEVRKSGNIVVTTNLDEASYTISGPDTFSGNGKSWTTANARPGKYTISFNHVNGYFRPHSRHFNVKAGKTSAVEGVYAKKHLSTHIIAGSGSADRNSVAVISIADGSGKVFSPFASAGKVKVAAGDLNGDGVDEIIVTNGRNIIKVFNAQGEELASKSFGDAAHDLEIAVGSVMAGGRASIVAAYEYGNLNANLVSVLSWSGKTLAGEVPVPFGHGGKAISIAIGDINGDGRKELIAASKDGLSAYTLRTFDLLWHKQLAEAARPVISAGDLDGDGIDEILIGNGPNASSPAVITIFHGDGTAYGHPVTAFEGYVYGVNVASGDADEDGADEIIAGAGTGPENPAIIQRFESDGTPQGEPLAVFEGMHGVHVGFGKFGSN